MMISVILATLSGSLQNAVAEEYQLQTDQAFAVHISSTGLDSIGQGLAGVLPSSIPIAAGSGNLECSSDSSLTYTLSDLEVYLQLDEVEFLPSENALSLMIYGHLGSSESSVDLTGDCSILENLSETCGIEISTTPFSINMDLAFEMDNQGLNVQVAEPVFNLAPITNPLSASNGNNCLLSDALDTILGQNPYMMSDLIVGIVEPELANLPETIESSLNGALSDLSIQQSIDLLGTPLDLNLAVNTVEVNDAGLLLGFASSLVMDISSSCVDPSLYPPPEDVDWPEFSGTVFGSSLPYDAGLFVGRHFVDQVLYAVWASGALCIDVAQMAGLEFTGTLAGAFFGEDLANLVGEDLLEIQLQPNAPFVSHFSDDQPPVSIILDDLVMDNYADIMGRRTRLMSVGMDADIGVFINLDQNQLQLDIPLDTERFFFQERYHDILPYGYSEGVPGLMDLALGSVLNSDQLPRLQLPAILGMDIEAIMWQPDENADWLGAHIFFNVDEVESVQLSGCSASDFGCGSSGPSIDLDLNTALGCNEVAVGCEGGCSQNAATNSSGRRNSQISLPAGRLFGFMVLTFGVWRRRRE